MTRHQRRKSHTRRDDYCLVFLHIPKAAGTSLSSSLVRNYPRQETIHLDILGFPGPPNPIPFHEEMGKLPLEKRSKVRLLWGHMAYSVHNELARHCEYVTVLREPVDRVISVYKYLLTNSDHFLHDRVVGEEIGLEEYVESGMDEGQTDNAQTRQLSGRQFGVLDREALTEAKRNLGGFLVVGLTDRFEETFVLLRRTLRLRLPFYVTRNVSPPVEVSKRAAELIRERNQLDLELYAFTHNLFSNQVRRESRSFGFEVWMFKAMRPLTRLAGAGGVIEDVLRKLYRTRAARRLMS